MEPWFKLSIWIGTFGFLKEFRPEDPYIIQYLTSPRMNFTDEQVNQEIFPVSTYVGLFELIFVFLITDLLRYKPVVVACALSGVVVQLLLIWGRGLQIMQIMEIFYGTYISTEVAYYTYIYAKVDKQYFQRVTSYMRAATLSGRFISSVVGQAALSTQLMTIYGLNYLTLLGMTLAFFWALGLPSVSKSLYFHREVAVENGNNNSVQHPVGSKGQTNGDVVHEISAVTRSTFSLSQASSFLWNDFKFAFTNPYVLKWCTWVALATGMYFQFMSYAQLLWQDVGKGSDKNDITKYNGAIEAVYTIISATAAFLFGRLELDWTLHGELLLGAMSFVDGLLLYLSSKTYSIIFCYFTYICCGALYHIMMTVACSEIAKHIKPDSYALVFGVNGFVSVLIQTIVTFTFVDKQGLALSIRSQFAVYGGFFVILSSFYLVKSAFTYMRYCRGDMFVITPERNS